MTTKETEIPTFYLTKKKKKQIYKITVWNVLLVVVVFLQDLFSYLKETLNLLRSTLWQVGTGIKQGNLFIYFTRMGCQSQVLKGQRREEERTKFKTWSNLHWFCMKTFGMFPLRGHDAGKWSRYEFILKSQKVWFACPLCMVSVWSMSKSRSALETTSPGY